MSGRSVSFPLLPLLADLLARRLAPWRLSTAFGRAPQVLGEAELRAMSDRELSDLGIGRSEVPGLLGDACEGGFWR